MFNREFTDDVPPNAVSRPKNEKTGVLIKKPGLFVCSRRLRL